MLKEIEPVSKNYLYDTTDAYHNKEEMLMRWIVETLSYTDIDD